MMEMKKNIIFKGINNKFMNLEKNIKLFLGSDDVLAISNK